MKPAHPIDDEMVRAPADLARHWNTLSTAARRLGFVLPAPHFFPPTTSGLQHFLDACNIEFFSAREVVRPNDPAKAQSVGYPELLPPNYLWPWAALLLKLADEMRRIVDQPVTLRNLWRPLSYNRLVAESGIASDHPNACGCDLDFDSRASRIKAEGFCRGVHAAMPELEISLGLGYRTVHLGVLSPKGSRGWFYGNYGDARVPLG